MKINKIKCQKDLSWLKNRQNYVCGTDAAVIMGFSPYKSKLELYHEKTNENPEFTEGNDKMKAGTIFEGSIIDLYQDVTGNKVDKSDNDFYYQENSILGCTPDGLILDENNNMTGIVEVKFTSIHNSLEWYRTGKIPEYYFFQCHHNMMVMNVGRCDFVYMVGNELKVHEILKDEDLRNYMTHEYNIFWQFVISKIEPKLESVDIKFMEEKFLNKENKNEYQFNDSEFELLSKYEMLDSNLKEMEKEKNIIKGELIKILSENESSIGKYDTYEVKYLPAKKFDADKYIKDNPKSEFIKNGIDTTKMKKKSPKIYDKYSKESSCRFYFKSI